MTLDSTLDLLYLVIGVAVLWVAAMLTWLLFEAALAMRNANRVIKGFREKMRWVEKTVMNIGDKFESSSAYMNAMMKGGQAIARFIRDRRAAMEDEDEDDRPSRKRRRR